MVDNLEALYISVVFYVPGLIIAITLSYLSPREKLKGAELLLHAFVYGAINLAIMGVPYYLLATSDLFEYHKVKFGLFLSLLTLIGPIIVGVMIHFSFKLLLFLGGKFGLKLSDPFPSAWDFVFFGREQPFYIVIHTKSGDLIRGRYVLPGRAASHESGSDLFLPIIFDRNWKQIDRTGGIYLSSGEIAYFQIIN